MTLTVVYDALLAPGAPAPVERRRAVRRVSAKFDSAQTTPDNVMHWRWADDLSARAAHSAEVRRTLRNRSRYECGNNSFLKGIVKTLADYVVGTGPTLNLLTDDQELNAAVSQKWLKHSTGIAFGRKLHQMRMAKATDGESFGVIFSNFGLRSKVKLDMRVIECDQVTSTSITAGRLDPNDGIIFDDMGNVAGYRILPHHPGDGLAIAEDPETLSSQFVIHWFNQDRPGQVRGIPETTPALALFSMLRRYTLATVLSAETAARLAAVVRTNSPPSDGPTPGDPFDIIEMPYNHLLTLPDGWDISQLRSEQPTTTHEMFKRAVITEAARCFSMPYAVAVGDASNHNFASGKLDYGAWNKAMLVDQEHAEDVVVEPFFEAWYAEAIRIPGYLPDSAPRELPDHAWLWDGQEFLDPREAGSRDTGLKNGSESLPRLFAKRGLDMTAEHAATAKALGMSLAEYQAAIRANLFAAAQKPAATTDQTSPQESGDGNPS